MPIYEYRCPKCGERFEQWVRSFSLQGEVMCPRCGNTEVEKAVSLFAGLAGGHRASVRSACSSERSL
ncbi:MAG: zinc ribbon domain-containing protein [Anaerolineae bacterium]|nr:zinc ribbon domain-containing protein [Anaerolineae bacterium]MDW8067692.1 zinc ribbon domain-containing protein [Anaerolineae bacterium]